MQPITNPVSLTWTPGQSIYHQFHPAQCNTNIKSRPYYHCKWSYFPNKFRPLTGDDDSGNSYWPPLPCLPGNWWELDVGSWLHPTKQGNTVWSLKRMYCITRKGGPPSPTLSSYKNAMGTRWHLVPIAFVQNNSYIIKVHNISSVSRPKI